MNPTRVEGIVSIKPRAKSVYDFLGLVYCFVVLLCECLVPHIGTTIFHTSMARYNLFVLKMPLNTNQLTVGIDYLVLRRRRYCDGFVMM